MTEELMSQPKILYRFLHVTIFSEISTIFHARRTVEVIDHAGRSENIFARKKNRIEWIRCRLSEGFVG